jgi:hypothetical protein
MKSISINGKKLHEVRMLMKPYSNNSVSYLSYPNTRIYFEFSESELILKVPPMLALELYRGGIIPQDRNIGLTIAVSGRKKGQYCIVDTRYPNSLSMELIEFTMVKQKLMGAG